MSPKPARKPSPARTKKPVELRVPGRGRVSPDRVSRSTHAGRFVVLDAKSAALDAEAPSLRTAFYRRLRSWAEDVARSAPEEVLADALASPSVRAGLVKLLTDTSAETDDSPATRLREKALARGLAAKETLRELAGGFRPTGWVAEHLGISRQAVDKRRKAGKLLAVEAADGTFAYPMCQFTSDGVVPGLEDALAALQVESPWERLSALVNPSPALGGRSVLSVLETGRSEKVREQALAALREFLQ